MTTCDVCYTSVYYSFREQRSVNIACRGWNCATSEKSLSLRERKSDAGLRT